LAGAAIVSLVIKEWGTAIALIVITLFNAVVGLRQEGKAASAMNALQSVMKATARVRRDGASPRSTLSSWCPACAKRSSRLPARGG
jgi:P-type Ca2+ transporter type 2C